MQANVIRPVDDIDDALIIAFVGHKVKLVGIDQYDAHVILLLTQEVEITLLDVLQIGIADFLLIATPTLANVALEARHVGIEVHQQLRLWHV